MGFNDTLNTLEAITRFKPIETTNGYMCLCPAHDDVGPSLSVKRATNGDFALLYCFAGCNYKDVLAHIQARTCVSPWTEEKARRANEPRKLVKTYVYRSANGLPVMRKLRFEPKSFAIQHWANGRWESGMNGVTPLLYNLPRIIKATTVFILEGEKAVDKLTEWRLSGTCSFNGASKSNTQPKWIPELYNPFLQDKHVILLPDNDDPGRAHMEFVFNSLRDVRSKKIIELPGLAYKDDFYDWAAVGNTIDDLRKLK